MMPLKHGDFFVMDFKTNTYFHATFKWLTQQPSSSESIIHKKSLKRLAKEH